jgi:hypothetical protein
MVRNQICAEAWNCGEEEKMDLVGDIHCLWEVNVDGSRHTCRSSLRGSILISFWGSDNLRVNEKKRWMLWQTAVEVGRLTGWLSLPSCG